METSDPLLLLTRPESESRAFLSAFEERQGFKGPSLIAPILKVEPVEQSGEQDIGDVVIVTSPNALLSAPKLEGVACHVVGTRSAAAVEALGGRVATAAGTATELIDKLSKFSHPTAATWLRGTEAAKNIGAELGRHGWSITPIISYRQVAQELNQSTLDQLVAARRVVAPVFSPLSARFLSQAWPSRAVSPDVIAISQNAADAWHGPRSSLKISSSPDGSAMMSVLADFFPANRVVAPKAGD